MRRVGIPPKALIILADLLSDLGNQFVGLTLLDLLFFKGEPWAKSSSKPSHRG
jgi:hypothetical protein